LSSKQQFQILLKLLQCSGKGPVFGWKRPCLETQAHTAYY